MKQISVILLLALLGNGIALTAYAAQGNNIKEGGGCFHTCCAEGKLKTCPQMSQKWYDCCVRCASDPAACDGASSTERQNKAPR